MDKKVIRTKQSDGDHFTLTLESSRKAVPKPKLKETFFYIGLVGDLGFAIVLPMVGGIILGAYIDRHFFLFPKATLLFLFIGILITGFSFVRILKDINRKVT